MGWLYGWDTRRELVAHLTATKSSPVGAAIHHQTAIAYTSTGYTVLWIVFEDVIAYDGGYVVEHGQFIACMLLGNAGGDGWGYKPVEESMGPCDTSCPLKYLDMVDETDPLSKGLDLKWRERVREYWAKRRTKTRSRILMTKTLARRFAQVGSQQSMPLADHRVIAQFQNAEGWKWYATEYNPKADCFFGYVEGFEDEWGDFDPPTLRAFRAWRWTGRDETTIQQVTNKEAVAV